MCPIMLESGTLRENVNETEKTHNEEIRNLCSSPSVFMENK